MLVVWRDKDKRVAQAIKFPIIEVWQAFDAHSAQSSFDPRGEGFGEFGPLDVQWLMILKAVDLCREVMTQSSILTQRLILRVTNMRASL